MTRDASDRFLVLPLMGVFGSLCVSGLVDSFAPLLSLALLGGAVLLAVWCVACAGHRFLQQRWKRALSLLAVPTVALGLLLSGGFSVLVGLGDYLRLRVNVTHYERVLAGKPEDSKFAVFEWGLNRYLIYDGAGRFAKAGPLHETDGHPAAVMDFCARYARRIAGPYYRCDYS